jgi:hypothetical protein
MCVCHTDGEMPLDQKTLTWKRPKALDGRSYPTYLRSYEVFDQTVLPVLAQHQPATFDDLSVHIDDPKARAALPRWLASAEWRSLVERHGPSKRGPRTYMLGQRAHVMSRRAA